MLHNRSNYIIDKPPLLPRNGWAVVARWLSPILCGAVIVCAAIIAIATQEFVPIIVATVLCSASFFLLLLWLLHLYLYNQNVNDEKWFLEQNAKIIPGSEKRELKRYKRTYKRYLSGINIWYLYYASIAGTVLVLVPIFVLLPGITAIAVILEYSRG